jgi:hypothetical protein
MMAWVSRSGSLALALCLGACASSEIAKQCAVENPMPPSMRVAPFFGIIGLGIAYATDGPAINAVSAKRDHCAEQKSAAKE